MLTLSLQDGAQHSTPMKVIYNRETGEPVFLSSKASRKAKREAKQEIKAAKIEAKKKKKLAKVQGHLQRVENRQEAKTARQEARHAKRQKRLDVKTEKQAKRLLRVKGREDIIHARQQSKLNKLLPGETPASTPQGGGGGGNGGGGNGGGGNGGGGNGGGGGSDYNDNLDYNTDQNESDFTDYEEMPTDQESQDGLSGPFTDILGKVLKAGSNLLTTQIPSITQQLPINLTSKQVIDLQNQKVQLQAQLKSANQSKIIFAVGSGALGVALGYFIAKK
jgi:hypothetical protein